MASQWTILWMTQQNNKVQAARLLNPRCNHNRYNSNTARVRVSNPRAMPTRWALVSTRHPRASPIHSNSKLLYSNRTKHKIHSSPRSQSSVASTNKCSSWRVSISLPKIHTKVHCRWAQTQWILINMLDLMARQVPIRMFLEQFQGELAWVACLLKPSFRTKWDASETKIPTATTIRQVFSTSHIITMSNMMTRIAKKKMSSEKFSLRSQPKKKNADQLEVQGLLL